MKKRYTKLLEIISDGDVYSGEELAADLDVTRAAIWKSIRYLRTLGLEIKAVRGKGYCLEKKFLWNKQLNQISLSCFHHIDQQVFQR